MSKAQLHSRTLKGDLLDARGRVVAAGVEVPPWLIPARSVPTTPSR